MQLQVRMGRNHSLSSFSSIEIHDNQMFWEINFREFKFFKFGPGRSAFIRPLFKVHCLCGSSQDQRTTGNARSHPNRSHVQVPTAAPPLFVLTEETVVVSYEILDYHRSTQDTSIGLIGYRVRGVANHRWANGK